MRKSRVVGLTALAAATALVISACSGTPGQAGGSTTAAPAESSGSAAASSGASAGADATSLPGAENVGKVGGSGCGIPHGPYEEPAKKGGEVRVAWNDPPLSFNNNTTHANAIASANIQYFTNTGFTYYDKDLNLINNDQFGTCEIVSLDPLDREVHRQRGRQVVRRRAGRRGRPGAVLGGAERATSTTRRPRLDDEGNLLPSAGVAFDKVDPSLSLIKDFPTIGDDGRSATFVWSKYYLDYQTACPANNGAAGTLIPAHVVGAKALGITDPADRERGVDRRVQEQRQGEAQADLRLLEHRLRRRSAADRPEPVPVQRPVQGHLLRAADEPDAGAEPGLQLGPDPVLRQDQLLDHR